MITNNEIPEKAFLIFDVIRSAQEIRDLEILKLLIEDRSKFEKKFLEAKASLDKKILDKKKHYEVCVDDFIKAIENASSSKEVDIYISYIEAEQRKLMGNPKEGENLIQLEKILRFLKEKPLGAKAISQTERVSLEDIQACELKISNLKKRVFDHQKENFFSEKMSVLHTLINYAEKSKLNFNRRLETSGTLQIISTVFTVMSDFLSVASFIPGINLLVTRGTSTACDLFAYTSLTASNATNRGVSESRKIAELRHFEALKKYALAEATTGGVGMLALTTGIAVGASAASAAVPLLAPAFLLAGAGVMVVNNIIASVSTYKELKRAEVVLKELVDESPAAANLSKVQKLSLERAQLRVSTLKAQLKAKVGTAFGSALVAVLAAGTLVAVLGFPPLGGALAVAFTVVAMASTFYSAFQKYKERSLAKATYKVGAEIENEERKDLIHTLKNESKIEAQPPTPDVTAELRVREKSKVERRTLTFHGEDPLPLPSKKEVKTEVPLPHPHPTPGKPGNGKK